MNKNMNKLILSGVILSVFIGITGYSIGVSNGNKMAFKNKLDTDAELLSKINELTEDNSSSQPSSNNTSSVTNNNHSSISKTNSQKKERNRNSSHTSRSSVSHSKSGLAKTLSVNTSNLKDGTYFGSARGYAGDVRVKVIVKGGKIDSIDVVSHSETPGYYEKGRSVISSILSKQKVDVDAISGATYTSEAIKSAVSKALKSAGASSSSYSTRKHKPIKKPATAKNPTKPVVKIDTKLSKAKLKDGTYTGVGRGYKSDIKVSVVVKDGKISSVKILSHGDDAEFFNRAKVVADRISSSHKVDVDTVSGATFSSNGIKSAVIDALKKAGLSSSDSMSKILNDKIAELKKDENEIEKLTQEIEGNTTLNLPQGRFKDGTYKGSARGFKSNIVVSVKVSQGKIASIKIESSGDDEPYFSSARGVINKIINSQNVNVDAVSGATFSSNGIKRAVYNALNNIQATDEVVTPEITEENSENVRDLNNILNSLTDINNNLEKEGAFKSVRYEDGTYTGEGRGFRAHQGSNDKITATVVIKDSKISKIEVSGNDDEPYFGNAKRLISNIISKQSPYVDAISNATYSSNGIKEAVKNALENAEKGNKVVTEETSLLDKMGDFFGDIFNKINN